jgi:hypothetical protein
MAGSWSGSIYNEVPAQEFSPFKTIEWTFTADAANGSVPDMVIPAEDLYYMAGKFITLLETVPGATAPTNQWDATLEDAHGDILGGALQNRAQTREFADPLQNGSVRYIPCDGRALTLKVANNSVNSATAAIRLFLSRVG